MTDAEFARFEARASRGDMHAASKLPMSVWAEARRRWMTPQTIAANARLERGPQPLNDIPKETR